MRYADPVQIGETTLSSKVNSNLVIKDLTLREGEQAADVNFSLDQKLRICDLLIEAGVRSIHCAPP